MTRPITIALQVRGKGRRDVQITPNWAGKGLAVHKPVILNGDWYPVFRELRGVWCITHIHTGLRVGMFTGSLDRARAFAREWDQAWAAVTTSDVPQQLRTDYLAALATANYGSSRQGIIEAGA